jgi:hypothetical protein
MALRVLKKQVITPVRGIDISKPGDLIDALSASNAQNVQVKNGVIQKRIGTVSIGSSLGGRILGMGELEVGINRYLVRIGLTTAQVLDRSGPTWSNIKTGLTGTVDDQIYFAYPNIGGSKVMVYVNGVDRPRKYDGSTEAALGGTPPVARFAAYFGGYMVLAYIIDGGDTFFARVQWSDTGDPETWTPAGDNNAGSIDLADDESNSEITGIHPFGDFLSVHKEGSIYLGQVVTTSEVFRFSRKETVGAVSNGSIQNLPGGYQCFLSRDGIRLFNGVSSDLIGSSINEELRDSMNPQQLKRATSILVQDIDEYWVGIPIGSDTEPQTVYKFNYKTGDVYKDSRNGLMVMALSRITDQESWDSDSESWDSDTTRWDSILDSELHKAVMFGDDDGVVTQRSNINNDNGTAIDAYWDSKDFTILDLDTSFPIGTMIRSTRMEVWAKGSGVTAYYSTDEGTTWTTIGTLTLSSSYPTDASPLFLYFDVISTRIRFRFRNNTAGQSFTLKQFWVNMSPREVRG